MRYLAVSGVRSADLPPGCRVVADGETISFEQPWRFGAPLIAQVDDGAGEAALKAKPGVTALSESFVPDRAVLMEFPSADDVAAFYFSESYAPLLRIRLKATEPRFVLVARAGGLPECARRAIADGLGKV